MQKTFISFIAEKYIDVENLYSYCFVFPNKRAGLFFCHELKKKAKRVVLMPEVTTISDFVNTITNAIEPNRIELQFILFEAYKAVMGGDDTTFEKFSSWADVLLSDFNDVDRYLVNAADLFRNSKELQEIKSNFLSQEQREFLSNYLRVPDTDIDTETFWTHLNSEKNKNDNYKKLWLNLLDLYNEFNRRLDEKGLSYSGKSYRKAVEVIKSRSVEDFEHKHYVFVGFNMLSASEMAMFKKMRDNKIADFLWDANSPAFSKDTNKAAIYIKRNKELFPSPQWCQEPAITTFPEVNVYSLPSDVGQAKFASKIIEDYIQKNIITTPENAIDTAIVLADENIFIPLLSSLPATLGDTNVSIGLSIKNSSVATFMGAVTKLHCQSRKSAKGECQYLCGDVKEVLTHPIMKSLAYNAVEDIAEKLRRGSMYLVDAKFLMEKSPLFETVFSPLRYENTSTLEVKDYIEKVLMVVNDYAQSLGDSEVLIAENVTLISSLEKAFVSQYATALETIWGLIEKYDVKLEDATTFLYLVDRIAGTGRVSFEGVPLKGLQIMGMLETRSLDFKNVTILSMNETVFPRKQFSNSFIPDSLRSSFGMSTMEQQEAMFAYYFYRLISRAERVNLLYDSRSDEMVSKEKSRYITQLQMLFDNCKVTVHDVAMTVAPPEGIVVEVKKEGRILERLMRYKQQPEAGKKTHSLSASSIKTYMKCGILFYLKYIEDLREEDSDAEFIEASTLGTIVHEALQHIYESSKKRNEKGEILITEEEIKKYLNTKTHLLEGLVRQLVNSNYLKKDTYNDEDLRGESMIVSEIVSFFVRSVLKYDLETTLANGEKTLTYVSGEMKDECRVKLGNNEFNFVQFIDRVDKETEDDGTECLRIIDYKTGKDECDFKTVDDVMNNSKLHAIVQVFMYAYVYMQNNPEVTRVKPMIYSVRNMANSGIKQNKKQVVITQDDETYNQIIAKISEIIDEIFNVAHPFTQGDKDACRYCQFASFCRR